MPANKYACSHVNQAYERLLHGIGELETPAFTLFPAADQFENAKEHLTALARLVDDYISAVAAEANSNSTTHISTKDRMNICGDALNNSSLLDDLQDAADTLNEGARERTLERAS